jgi:hypothetical protein
MYTPYRTQFFESGVPQTRTRTTYQGKFANQVTMIQSSLVLHLTISIDYLDYNLTI